MIRERLSGLSNTVAARLRPSRPAHALRTTTERAQSRGKHRSTSRASHSAAWMQTKRVAAFAAATMTVASGLVFSGSEVSHAAEPTVENPVLFTVRGRLLNNGTSLQYDIDINGVYAGQSYLSANIVYPVQLTLNTAVLGTTVVCQNSSQSNCWGISTQKSDNYSTTNMIWRGTPARTAAQLKDALEPLYFTLTNPGVFPPDPSTVAIEASADKVTQFVDDQNLVHWYKFVSQTNITWLNAYNAAQAARMQDPRDPENTSAVLDGYMATITSHAEQMKVYNDIAKDCGWLGGTRILKANGRKPIVDDLNLPTTFPGTTTGSNPTGYVTNTGTPDAKYWYWADGPEAGHIFFTPATTPSTTSGGVTVGDGKTIGYPGTGTPGNLPAIVQPGGSGGFTGWNYYSFFGNGEPNNYTSAAQTDINQQGEYFLQFAYTGASNPTGTDQNYPSYITTDPANPNYQPPTARWNDFPATPTSGVVLGYYVEFGGYEGDPTAEELGNVSIQSISTVDLVMPIQIRYRSTEPLPIDPETYESHRQMTGVGTTNDRLITYERDLPYTAVRDITPTGSPFSPPPGYTYYDWEFMGNPADEANLSSDANSVSGFHSLHYQYITFLYQPVDVQVTFNANFPGWNSASVTPQTKTVKYDTPYGALAATTRPGYTFTGWYTQASGGNLVDENTVVNQTTAHTLYAHWTENTNYTVTYDLACPAGATCSATPTPKTGVAWTSSNLLPGGATPTATIGGETSHIFVGWDVVATGSEGTGKQGVTASDVYSDLASSGTEPGITLRARWIDARYIWVLYHLNGGTTAEPLEDMYAEVHIGVVPLPQPQRPGYTFTGWMVTDDGTGHHGGTYPSGSETTYDELAAPSAKYIVVEAQWTPNTYTVNYNGNGATWSGAPKTGVSWESNGFTPPTEGNPTRTGFVFMGWNTAQDGSGVAANSGTSYSALAGNDQIASVTLFAQWQAERTYFVRYDTNGGTPSTISDLTGVYLSSANLLPTSPTPPTGYSFSGWKVTYNGTKSGVQPSDTFGSLAADPNAGFIVLQAQYSPTQRYQLQYNVTTNGGDAGYVPELRGYSTNNSGDPRFPELIWTQSGLVPLVDPTKTNAVFLGWNTKADGTGHTLIPSDTYGDIATAAGGVTQCTATAPSSTVQIVGRADAASNTVTIPAHQPGDIIVIVARRANNTAPTKPSASGTVPTWTTLGSTTGANTLSQVVAYTNATASNHTAGTWTNATHMVAIVLRNSEGTGLSIGGTAASQNNGSSTSISRPSITPGVVPTGGGQLYLTAVGKATSTNIDTTPPTGMSLITAAADNLAAIFSEPTNSTAALTNASAVASTVTRFQVIAAPPQSPIGAASGCTVVYAIFAAANSYTVIYDLNGGSGSIGNETLSNVSMSVPLPTPTPPTGYEFSHWYVSNNGNGMSNPAALAANTPYSTLAYGDGTSEHPYKNTITLRASYTLKHAFTVQYVWNYEGASIDPTPVTGVTWTQAGFVPHSATQSGKTLLGWTLDAGGNGSFVLPGTPFSTLAATFCAARPGDCAANGEPSVPIPLYAQWEDASFVVQYDLNGLAAPVGWVSSRTVGFDDAGLIPDAALNRVGYELAGWKVSVNGTTTATVQPSDSFRTLAVSGASYITLQAQWVAKSYVVNYNGGWSGAAPIPSTPSSGEGSLRWTSTVPLPSAGTRPGYTFANWQLWKRGTTELASPTTVVAGTAYSALALDGGIDYSNITLRAVWTPKNYTVNYDLTTCPNQTGSWTPSIAPKTPVTWDDAGLLPTSDPVCPGYAVTGWTISGTGAAVNESSYYRQLVADESVMNVSVSPTWQQKSNVTYNYSATDGASAAPSPSSGSLAPATGTATSAQSTAADPATGYQFDGWYAASDLAHRITSDRTFVPFKVNGEFPGGAFVARYVSEADPLLPDPVAVGETGTMVITKLKNPESVHPGTGREDSTASGEPLAGVSFEICQVTGDGTTMLPSGPWSYSWWEAASEIASRFDPTAVPLDDPATFDPADERGPYYVGTCYTPPATGDDGQVILPALPIGLYLVREYHAPDGTLPADPFLVTLPITGLDGGWILRTPGDPGAEDDKYIVWVYPKNSLPEVEKEAITDDTYSVDSPIGYTVTAKIPCIPGTTESGPGCVLIDAVITDTLADGATWIVPGTGSETAPVVKVNGEVLVNGADPEEIYYEAVFSGNVLTITFTEAGLDILRVNIGNDVTVELVAYVLPMDTITGGGFEDGVENEVKVDWNHHSTFATAQVDFGGVVIHKYDETLGDAKLLPDVDFRIFGSEAAATDWTPEATDGWLTAADISGEAEDLFTTDENGVVAILGLFYTDDDTDDRTCTVGEGETAKVGTQYWLRELAAPSGYVASSAAIPVCVTGIVDTNPLDPVDHSLDDVWVPNVPHNAGFPLPFTGDGQVDSRALAALLIVVSGVGIYIIHTRRARRNMRRPARA